MVNDELVKALEYYAEVRNYNPVCGGTDIPIFSDKGQRARWALEELANSSPTQPSEEGKPFSQIALERAGYEVVPHMPDMYSMTIRKNGKGIAHYWPKLQWWNIIGERQAETPKAEHQGRGLEALVDRLKAVAP